MQNQFLSIWYTLKNGICKLGFNYCTNTILNLNYFAIIVQFINLSCAHESSISILIFITINNTFVNCLLTTMLLFEPPVMRKHLQPRSIVEVQHSELDMKLCFLQTDAETYFKRATFGTDQEIIIFCALVQIHLGFMPCSMLMS